MTRAESEIRNTRLTIDLPSSMHRMVKAHATLSDLSIKDFIIEAIEMRFDEERAAKKEVVSKNKMNAKTIATIRNSIKNHDKLRTFNNSKDAMKWLLAGSKVKKKKIKS